MSYSTMVHRRLATMGVTAAWACAPVLGAALFAACDFNKSSGNPPIDTFPTPQPDFDSSTPDAGEIEDATRPEGGHDAAAATEAAAAEASTSSDAGPEASPPDAATDAAPVAVAHLYASNATAGSVTRFDVVSGQISAAQTAQLPVAGATGLAIGPAGILYVGQGSAGGVARIATPGGTPQTLASLPAPSGVSGWAPSAVAFAPGSAGAGFLWVASSGESSVLVLYALDATGALVGSPSLVSTGLAADAGPSGIQGLAWDATYASLFASADTIHRFAATAMGSSFSLTEIPDANLSPLGAKGPAGLVAAPNGNLIGVYPSNSSFLNIGYWQVSAGTTTLLQGGQGTGNTFSPVALALLPTQPAAEPVEVYVGTQQNQVVAIDVTSASIPAVTAGDLVCDVNGIAGVAMGP